MLKEQRVVMKDPELPFEPSAVSPPSKLATFEDEEKANLLSQLLKSKNKEDLQAANRLIKSMVRSVSMANITLMLMIAVIIFVYVIAIVPLLTAHIFRKSFSLDFSLDDIQNCRFEHQWTVHP